MESVKIVLLGNSGVGKTSILQRFTFNQFKAENPSTLGAMFIAKTVEVPEENTTVKFNIWDTAGQEKYRSLAANYYQDAAVALVVYDITEAETFEGAKIWLDEVREKVPQETLIVLTANKSDLLDREAVDPVLAKEFADKEGLWFRLTSAKDGEGVNELFTDVAKEISKKRRKEAGVGQVVYLTGKKLEAKRNKRRCC